MIHIIIAEATWSEPSARQPELRSDAEVHKSAWAGTTVLFIVFQEYPGHS
jgi:hypothetical protein